MVDPAIRGPGFVLWSEDVRLNHEVFHKRTVIEGCEDLWDCGPREVRKVRHPRPERLFV